MPLSDGLADGFWIGYRDRGHCLRPLSRCHEEIYGKYSVSAVRKSSPGRIDCGGLRGVCYLDGEGGLIELG